MIMRKLFVPVLAAISFAQAQTTQEFSTLFYTGEYQEALTFYEQHQSEISIDPALVAQGKKFLNDLEEKITSLSSAYYAKKGVSFLGTMGKYLGTSIGFPAVLISALGALVYKTEKNDLEKNPQDAKAAEKMRFNYSVASISGGIAIVSYGFAAAAKATEYVAQNSVTPYEKNCAKAAALKKLLSQLEQQTAT